MKREAKINVIENIAGFFMAMFLTAASTAVTFGCVAIIRQLFSL